MKSAPLIAFLILGGAVAFVLWDSQRRKPKPTPDTTTTNNPAVTQVDSLTKSVDDLSSQVTELSGKIGKLGGGSAGAAAGNAVSAAEQQGALGLGSTPLTHDQIVNATANSSLNGLTIGATSAANVATAAGGATGAGPFDFLAGFFQGAASSEFLKKGGIADQLGLPKL